MKIKTRIAICGTVLAILPVIVASLFISKSTTNVGQLALEDDARQSLVAIREATASQITDYIQDIRDKSSTLAESLMVVDSMKAFRMAFNAYRTESSDANNQLLKTFYIEEFKQKFEQLNQNEDFDEKNILSGLSTRAMNLQYDFIANNPHALGEKHLLNGLDKPSEYSKLHEKYHAIFRSYIEKFGFYDLFLVDHESGDIVYSVFKELDFATSLMTGPYANTGIAQAFDMAKNNAEKGQTHITDLASYLPSYNAPASFISTPIYDGTNIVGILILQMPVDKIDDVMTHKGRWLEHGLGQSGETYVVGEDFLMRSNGRFLLESKQEYLALMASIGTPQEIINAMDAQNTSIGLQRVKTKGTQAALSGEKGFDIFKDYRNVEVLSAYSRLDIDGLNW